MEKLLNEKIKEYWNEQARYNAGKADKLTVMDWEKDLFVDSKGQGGTLKDHNLREIEVQSILNLLKPGSYVLDIGCGNGFSTLEYAKRMESISLMGMDYSEEMINNAQQLLDNKYPHLKDRVTFKCQDMLKLSELLPLQFDIVCSTRAIINIPTWEEQQQAMDEIRKVLKEKGTFLMLEGSITAITNLNKVREAMGLKPLTIGNWHNLHLEDDKLREYFKGKYEIKDEIYHSSTYMLVTRALYHKVLLGKYIDQFTYDEDVFESARKMPNFGEFGMQKIFVLEKI